MFGKKKQSRTGKTIRELNGKEYVLLDYKPVLGDDPNVKNDTIQICEEPYSDEFEDIKNAPILSWVSVDTAYPKVGEYVGVYHKESGDVAYHEITRVEDNSDGRYDTKDYTMSELIIFVDPFITNLNFDIADAKVIGEG